MLRAALTLLLAACVAIFIATTWHWPLVGDAVLIRYVNFLMGHGMAPYRDIVDINMPGAYAVDWFASHAFGPGPVAWRLFDLCLMAAATGAALVVAWPYDWFAAVWCGALLTLVHGRDGVAQTGQRDLTMAVLLLWSAALLLVAERRDDWRATALFGLLAGCAATIKPTVFPLGFILLLTLVWELRRRRMSASRHAAAGIAGLLVAPTLVLLFLLREHAVPAFFDTLLHLIPYHAAIDRQPWSYFLRHAFTSPLLAIAAVWLMVLAIGRPRLSWERGILLICLGFGLLSLVVQGKGYLYHRYPSEAFLLLLAGIDLTMAAKAPGAARYLAALGVAFGTFFLAPAYVVKAAGYQWRNVEFRTMLERDLNQLGGPVLSSRVQCMDTIGGCIDTLEQMHLVQSTGFLYDCYLFGGRGGPTQQDYRARFWREFTSDPPQVVILTNQSCMDRSRSFARIRQWPRLASYLTANYAMAIERTPQHAVRWWSWSWSPVSYRIYVRNGSAAERRILPGITGGK